MKYLSLFLLATSISISTQAKIWRVNNTPGVIADFSNFETAVNTAAANDTIYLESSALSYGGSPHLTKKLTIIGPGYHLDPSDGGNAGLQVTTQDAYLSATLQVDPSGTGSKIMGFVCASVYLNGTSNITFERMRVGSVIYFHTSESTNITFRKCYFNASGFLNEYSGGTVNGLTFENNIAAGYVSLTELKGSSNIIRNNNFTSGSGSTFVNAYFVNNIISGNAATSLTNCTIKNNIFRYAQTLPGTATGNKVSQNMDDVFINTGSTDGKYKLKAGSPASGAGLSANGVNNPDCGAFGATDPYVLSGIPNIPTIYSLTAPTSIPSGSATMNITFSTRNNN
ncbi:hypothetical protein [Paraflavitalea pollutisoli]|uniref:hypothetical protein n=1 Tax=Paraflavitalea pollutisoli TaxID=3034143 RepID=UPI0023EB4443|nr:hypothetical protein [Paraflavitalea sp. H1-2-19X]